MSAAQLQLLAVHVDERTLGDVPRTILEAIDLLGSITARQAGRIVYRFRGFDDLLAIPGPWLTSAGKPVLERLEREGLARHRRGRWRRMR